MSLDEPQKNKVITAPPAKKGFHFAATAEHLAEFIEAETVQEAEVLYHKVKRPIVPVVGGIEQSTSAPAAPEEKEVQ